jgi:hypothetical protein
LVAAGYFTWLHHFSKGFRPAFEHQRSVVMSPSGFGSPIRVVRTGESDGVIHRHPLRPTSFDAGILSCSPADPPRLVGWKSLSQS